MTESPTPPVLDEKPKRSPSRVLPVLVFLFRLLLLGVGGTLAGLIGVAIAQFYPGNLQEPPLLEQVFRRSTNLLQNLRGTTQPTSPPIANSPSPSIAPSPSVSVAPLPPLSEPERQQIQTEITQIRSQLQVLSDRTTTLETQLGSNAATNSLEARLQSLENRLNPNAASPVAPPPSATAEPPIPVAATTQTSETDTLKVTLPSDALFATDKTSLRPETQPILDSITTDLQQYPGASILVAAHTDDQNNLTTERILSFAQATSVKQYLSKNLGTDHHWVVVGYGNTQAIAPSDTDLNRQRNRRIEITILPKE